MSETKTQLAPAWGAILEPTEMEVGTGGPGYRWAAAVHIITPDGAKLYPPMLKTDAIAICKREGWPIIKATGQA